MKNGFLKVAAATPELRVADCEYNVNKMISISEKAVSLGVKLIVFPELSITSSTCGDMFFNSVLTSAATDCLKKYNESTSSFDLISVIGLPVEQGGRLYNCAAVCHGGRIIGLVPKTALSSEEMRFFSNGSDDVSCCIGEENVPFGTNLVFGCTSGKMIFDLSVNVGDEGLLKRAHDSTVIAIPAASHESVCKDEFRRTVLKAVSGANALGCVYANAGYGESTTDYVFAAHNIICENGSILTESLPFEIDYGAGEADRITVSELDVELLGKEKRKLCGDVLRSYRHISINIKEAETDLTRKFHAMPFVPEDEEELYKRAEIILKIQSAGLRKRMDAAYAKKCIIGISGGLDSTLALLVAARACDEAKRPRKDIIGITMPCFGTTSRTKSNAEKLCAELGIEFRTVMIGDSVKSHFNDIGHDINDHNVVYENAQARERTQVLMDIANAENGVVIGTGDMSELALGWATYNGDHMSMYGVNASIPKTLVRALTRHCATLASKSGKESLAAVLIDIIDTPVSPELLPADGDNIKQKTEDLVGPYEIHDFYLYYMLRFGFSPEKLYRMACHALGHIYDSEVLLKWLEVFTRRFFSQQYKRSCLPDGPAVGSVGLSPRGGLRMPSDASSAAWMAEIEKIKVK